MAHVGWAGDGYARVKIEEVVGLLDDTWFAWMGGTELTDPFYSRLLSPSCSSSSSIFLVWRSTIPRRRGITSTRSFAAERR